MPARRRDTLIARRTRAGEYEFNIVLEGAQETVFFEAQGAPEGAPYEPVKGMVPCGSAGPRPSPA